MPSTTRVRQALRWVLATVAIVAMPSSASATVYTFTPNPNDLGDLDHFYVYTWKINTGINLSTSKVDSATLKFKQMYNWDSNANDLFLHLLDTARVNVASTLYSGTNGSVSWFKDETSDPSPLNDDFVDTRYHNDANWIVAAGTSDAYLTERSFSPLGGQPVSANPGPDPNPAGWSWAANGSLNGKTLYDYTYTFTPGQLAALGQYISASADIALGFDPDCHFYNSGITFTVNVSQVPNIPEPASLVLLGTGLLAVRRRSQKRKG